MDILFEESKGLIFTDHIPGKGRGGIAKDYIKQGSLICNSFVMLFRSKVVYLLSFIKENRLLLALLRIE